MSSTNNASSPPLSDPQLQKEFLSKKDQVLGKDNLVNKTKDLFLEDTYEPETKTFKQEFKDELQNKKQEMLGKNIDSQNWVENKLLGGNKYNPKTKTIVHQDMKRKDPQYEEFKKELNNKKDEIMGDDNLLQKTKNLVNPTYHPKTKTFKQEFQDEIKDKKNDILGENNETSDKYNPETQTFKEEFNNEMLNKKHEMLGKNIDDQTWIEKNLMGGSKYNPKTETIVHQDMKKVDPCYEDFKKELNNEKNQIMGEDNWVTFGKNKEYNPQTQTFKQEFKDELLNKKTEMIGKNESQENLFDKAKDFVIGKNYNPKTKTNKQEFQDELTNVKKNITNRSPKDDETKGDSNIKDNVKQNLHKTKDFIANKMGSDNKKHETTQFKENSEILDNMLENKKK